MFAVMRCVSRHFAARIICHSLVRVPMIILLGITQPGARRRWWQFGLASLLLAVTLAAVAIAIVRNAAM